MNNGNEQFRSSENSQQDAFERVSKITIPVVEEQVKVSKEVIETARVTLSKKVNESTESFEIPLTQEEIVIKRIPKNELIDTMPAAQRYEGDVMIIPVLKEVAVIEKRIMLVEEIHISKLKTEKTETRDVTVRKEEVNVTRKEL
ncbi:YsnF/AvaK domain-containing protein [Segetibacter koreensis]|uniref:YsnF/AvaK domain-containing protein n=1 Tax=Segetibacter koreensis TaxID=398037 RepID=UPI000376D5AB|nr:YsnF/AvaK domain-containing protein [Segetibacter koreensis]